MKKIISLLLLSVLISSCKKEAGTIKGNLSWEHKDGGKRTEAGAAVRLFNLAPDRKSQPVMETTADSKGNFIFKEVEPGKYFYLAKSKNVKACPEYIVFYLELYKNELKSLFDFDSSKLDSKIMEIEDLNDRYSAILNDDPSNYASVSEKVDSYNAVKAEIAAKCQDLLAELPDTLKRQLNYLGTTDYKVGMGAVGVKKNETVQLGHDFGTSCF